MAAETSAGYFNSGQVSGPKKSGIDQVFSLVICDDAYPLIGGN
jgi:hypothetical protein